MNPVGKIPTIIDNHFKVMGNTTIFMSYLANSKTKVSAYFPSENRAKMEQYMNWYMSVLRPSAKRAIQVMIGPKAFGDTQFSGEEVDEAK